MREAICGLNAEGALGLDGIPVFFYIYCWAWVGPDVMALMEEFHPGACHMGRINRAYITLLLKVSEVERVGDFRPISLSNIIYLIIAKVLANCFRGLLGTLISPLQSAFVPFFFFFELRGKGTPKQCPPDVIEEMTKSTDHVLQGYRNRGA